MTVRVEVPVRASTSSSHTPGRRARKMVTAAANDTAEGHAGHNEKIGRDPGARRAVQYIRYSIR